MKNIILSLIMITLCSSIGFSQSMMAVSEDQAKAFYNEIKNALEDFSGNSNVELFHKYYDDSFRGTTITLRPKRTPEVKNLNYGTLFTALRKSLSDGSKYNYKNFSLENIIINDPYAVLSIKHDYFITNGDEVRLEGSNVVSYVLKNINNEIKIVSQSSISNIPAEYIGQCYCRFSNENNDYSITVEYPYGNDFARVVESVYKIPGDRRLFIYEGKTYRWDGNLKVFRYNPTTDSDMNSIGDAASFEMAMARAIQTAAYKEICLNMRIYKK